MSHKRTISIPLTMCVIAQIADIICYTVACSLITISGIL